MPTFAQIKSNVAKNLADTGIFYDAADLQYSVQDGYDDVVCLSRCIIKKVTLSFQSETYYDFSALGVSDFLGVVAIYNNQTNKWLCDNLTLRHLELMDDSWEIRTGTPEWWVATNFKYTAIGPRYSNPSSTFDLFYWATAPTVVDADVPLIPLDLHKLCELYSTPDLLEQATEYTKSENYWRLYYELIEVCKERIQNLARYDLRRFI